MSLVYGVSACRALFMRRSEDIERVYLTEERIPQFGDLLSVCARRRLPYRIVPVGDLEAVTESRHHEGVAILARRRVVARLEDMVRAPGPACLLGMAGVGNPHNVGAILRTAAHFGVRGVVFLGGAGEAPEAAGEGTFAEEGGSGGAPAGGGVGPGSQDTNGDPRTEAGRGAAVTPAREAPLVRLSAAAARTSEGGAEWLELGAETDLARTLRVARAAGFTVAATSSHSGPHDGRSLYAAPLPARLLLLLGSEDEGLSPAALAAADVVLSIPGTGQIDSLNVAAAAAVLLGEHWKIRTMPRANPPAPTPARGDTGGRGAGGGGGVRKDSAQAAGARTDGRAGGARGGGVRPRGGGPPSGAARTARAPERGEGGAGAERGRGTAKRGGVGEAEGDQPRRPAAGAPGRSEERRTDRSSTGARGSGERSDASEAPAEPPFWQRFKRKRR